MESANAVRTGPCDRRIADHRGNAEDETRTFIPPISRGSGGNNTQSVSDASGAADRLGGDASRLPQCLAFNLA